MLYDKNFVSWLRRSDPESYICKLLTAPYPAAEELVKEIEENFARLSEKDKPELAKRLKGTDREVFWTAATELFFWDFFTRRLGFQCEIHPSLNTSKAKPEFTAKKGRFDTLVEVRTLFAEKEDEQSSKMFDKIIDSLKKRIPNKYPVHVSLYSKGLLPPNLKYSQVVKKTSESVKQFVGLKTEKQKMEFEVGGIKFNLYLAKLGSKKLAFGWGGGESFIHNEPRIRKAIKNKLQKYGNPQKPYILVIDSQDWFKIGREAIERALFGNIVITFPINARTGEVAGGSQAARDGKGLLRPDSKHTRLSAIVYHRFRAFATGNKRDIFVYHNPFAKYTIPSRIFGSLPQLVPVKTFLVSGDMKWKSLPKREE